MKSSPKLNIWKMENLKALMKSMTFQILNPLEFLYDQIEFLHT